MMNPLTLAQSPLQQAQVEISLGYTNPDDLIAALVRILDLHDSLSASHAFGVAIQADAIALALDMDSNRRQQLWRAALMHDIGKLAVPAEILRHAGPLSHEALSLIHQHPIVGADLLEQSDLLCDIAPFVCHHHERWDGTGYPFRLRGEQIPAEARIIGLCDAVHSMSMTRPYQLSRTPDKIISEVERCAGTQFDPKLAALLRHTHGMTIFVPLASASRTSIATTSALTPWPI